MSGTDEKPILESLVVWKKGKTHEKLAKSVNDLSEVKKGTDLEHGTRGSSIDRGPKNSNGSDSLRHGCV